MANCARKIDDQEIPREDTPKYLGFTLDKKKKLKWTEHLKNRNLCFKKAVTDEETSWHKVGSG